MFYTKYLLKDSPDFNVQILDTTLSAFPYENGKIKLRGIYNDVGFLTGFMIISSVLENGKRVEHEFKFTENIPNDFINLSEKLSRTILSEPKEFIKSGDVSVLLIDFYNPALETRDKAFEIIKTLDDDNKVIIEIPNENVCGIFRTLKD